MQFNSTSSKILLGLHHTCIRSSTVPKSSTFFTTSWPLHSSQLSRTLRFRVQRSGTPHSYRVPSSILRSTDQPSPAQYLSNCELSNCTIFNSSLVDSKLCETKIINCSMDNCAMASLPLALRRFTPEIRAMILAGCIEFKDRKTPALIIALRGDKDLYQEAIRVFYKLNRFKLKFETLHMLELMSKKVSKASKTSPSGKCLRFQEKSLS
jgi:hypothetical protein